MPLWSKRSILTMFSRRLATGALRILHSPLQVIALLLSLTLIWAFWSNSHIDGRGRRNVVDFIKQTDSLAYFRPMKRDKAMKENKSSQNNGCPLYQFKAGVFREVHEYDAFVTCKRLLPVPGSCDTAKEIFDLQGLPIPASCSSQDRIDFCNLQYTRLNVWIVVCDVYVTKVCSSGLQLGLPSHETGELVWDTYESADVLANTLTQLVQGHGSSNIPPHYGFAFIACDRKRTSGHQLNENSSYYYYEYQEDEDFTSEQLLILPPFIERSSKVEHQSSGSFPDINLNIILVDSVSHQHMFRSLPKTVSILEQRAATDDVDVFNFELFQAIKSRTFETLQTIMSGYVNVTETPFGRYDVPSKPLNLAPIYKPFQKRGYRTLWLEDLCYLWEWGISKDLRFLQLDSSPEDTWKRMWVALNENGVENIDATISMCRLLKSNGVQDHFHGPDAVCFNGRHQHEYILEYLQLYQQEMSSKAQPFFTMTSTNVAHEQTGKRVQTLDTALANYAAFASSLKNTVSIIFSDHGNAYGKYFQESKEAMIELFHPFMFIIIPHSAGVLLGKDLMDSLRLNTKRLISSLDVHYTLLYLADVESKGHSKAPDQQFPVNEKGLFHPVDPERDCYSVPRLKPSVCICQTPSVKLKASSFGSLFGYLAVGALNDEIQFQYRQSLNSSTPITAFGHCEPLSLENIMDLKEIAGHGDEKFFQMNIHVQQSQIFFVSVALTRNKEGYPKAVLESYSRMTSYGIYSNCSDKAVELALCICNLSANDQKFHHYTHHNQNLYRISNSMHVLPYFSHSVSSFHHTPCFRILSAIHENGKALYGINECQSVYTLTMTVGGRSKFMYFHKKEDSVVLPGGIALFGLVVSEYGEVWKDDVHTEFTLTKH